MDKDILKAILNSYEDTEKVTQSEDYENISRETLLCPQSDIFKTLCASLSSLLYHKISKEAYQRYSIRMLIIVCLFFFIFKYELISFVF